MHLDRTGALLKKGHSLQNAGRLREAAETYRQVLRISPRHPDALHLLGMVSHRAGHLEEAADLMTQSLSINPNNAGALDDLAGVLKDLRQFDRAVHFYQAALALTPAEADIHCNLGVALRELGRQDEAISCYHRAIELDPKCCAAYSNLGAILQARGQCDQALDCYKRALAINSRSPQILTSLGSVLNELGRHSEAVRHHEMALKLDPNLEAAHTNLGAAFINLGRYPESIASSGRALRVNPKSCQALNNLGNALTGERRLKEAAACLQKALEIDPACHLTYNNLGVTFREMGHLEQALAFLRTGVELKPDDPHAHRNLGSVQSQAGNAREAVSSLRRALELKPDFAGAFSELLHALNYLPRDNPEQLFAEHLRFDELVCKPLRKLARPHLNPPQVHRRLRVGFVSGDLCDHPVANFIEPVFANYSRSEFKVYCYANHRVNDAVSARLRNKVDFWRNVDTLSDAELAGAIREGGIDILVDLSGHGPLNRLLVFARKPAPVQVSMIGYLQTTGMSAMDYRITDETLDPAGVSDRLSAEKLIRLPAGAVPFQPPRNCPPVNELPALKNGFVTFASFNNLSKVTPEVIAAWADLLRAAPGSKLLVVGRDAASAGAALQSHGIPPERLEMLERKPMAEYLALHHRADFVLDAFPCNGGAASLIAAWMGLPFVTISGCDTSGRVGAGILKIAGLPQLVAANPADYVRKAADAAGDLQRLAAWRAAMRPRIDAWAGGGSAFTRQLESAFRDMWRRWCEAQPARAAAPEHAPESREPAGLLSAFTAGL